jgi:hypothetical protein
MDLFYGVKGRGKSAEWTEASNARFESKERCFPRPLGTGPDIGTAYLFQGRLAPLMGKEKEPKVGVRDGSKCEKYLK